MPDTPFSLKLYRFLLKFYPVGFHDDYAGPMEREFRDELAESSSIFALARLWIRLLADLAVSIPLQFLREVLQDARHTLRLWRNRPYQTGFAVLALAIGIGANTGVFSVVNALLLRSLPFHDPSRLVSLGTFFPPHDSAKDFHEWRQQQSAYLSDAALVEQFDVNLGEVPNPKRAHISVTSWNFFSILGAQPVIGRFFQDGEDEPRNNSVAVISYGLWQQLFAGDQRALGSTLRANGKLVTIIGVAPPGFRYPSNTDLWKAAEYSPGNNGWETIARLKPGVTGPQAHAAFTVEVERLWPQRDKLGNSEQHPRMISLQDELAGPAKNASLMLMVGVVLILLIACSNIANLLMARTAERTAEISIRCALGASRARIAQQLLTECLLLSFVAAAAGLFVALWTTTLAASVQPTPLSTQTYSLLDGRVWLLRLQWPLQVALCLAFCRHFTPDALTRLPHAVLLVRAVHDRFAKCLSASQVMLTIILLTAAISVGRAFISLMRTDRGFNTNGLVTVSVSLTGTTHDGDGRQLPYFEEALARIRRLPGVRSASETEFLPLDAKGFVGGPFKFDGREAKQNSTMIPVFGDYFKTMGGRVVYGREFNDAEVRADADVAVVNERFAAEFGSPVRCHRS